MKKEKENAGMEQHKCPQCGAGMVFDAASGMLVCEYCQFSIDIEQYVKEHGGEYEEQAAKSNVNEDMGEFREVHEETSENEFEEGVVKYVCENCAAELVVSEDTTATKCGFCGSPMILKDRMQGKRAPTKVIPFHISKEEAVAEFKKWCKNGKITPRDFMTAERISDIVGIYVPFWQFDLAGQGEIEADCTRVSRYSSGNYNVTATKHYKVWRKMDLDYDRVPVDASERMNDELMDKLEPFYQEDVRDYSSMYLPGYVAEGYNYTDDDLLPRVRERVGKFMDEYARDTMRTYATVNITRRDYHILKKKTDYTLLPVWMINYDYRDGEYVFLMNGETGKVVGKPPISIPKVAAWFLGTGGALFLVLRLITVFLLGGGVG